MDAFRLLLATMALLATGCSNPASDAFNALGELGQNTTPSNSVQYSEWQSMVGWHDLETLDGKDVRALGIRGVIFSDRTSFKSTDGKFVEAIVFPLYMSAQTGTSASIDFGVIRELGTSSVAETANGKVYTYSYSGPILIDGSASQVVFSMTTEVSNSIGDKTKKISYSFEAVGETQKIAHTFVLR